MQLANSYTIQLMNEHFEYISVVYPGNYNAYLQNYMLWS